MIDSRRKGTLFAFASVVLLMAVFIAALMIGRYSIPHEIFFEVLFGNPSHPMEQSIIMNLRMPRTIIAALAGTALSVSGLIYQETFQNKLVSPDLLGVTNGASVGAALAILLGLSSAYVSAFAFALGIVTVMMTLSIAKGFRNRSSTVLVLSGIFVGGFMASVLSFIKYLADPESTLADITFWLMGSCASSLMRDVWVLLPIIVVCSGILLAISYRINIISLGREEAQTKGINYSRYRILIVGLATLMTASAVSFVGSIGWIGLVVPHIVRLAVGRNTAVTIPLTIVFGAIFMMLADMMSRSFTSAEIPLSAITGFFGTTIFIGILFLRRRTINDSY